MGFHAPIPVQDLMRNFFSAKPKDVDGVMNTSALYYREKLLRLLLTIFKHEGLPDEWDLDYMQTSLFIEGLFTITDTSAGVLPLKCGVSGYNVFNHPTTVIVANPVLGNFERTIDKDCAVVRLQYTWHGVNSLLDRYSYLLAACDSSIAVNLMNTKATFIGEVENKAQAQTLKAMYDQITCGNPAVFVNTDISRKSNFYIFNAKQQYIAGEVQDLKRSIMNDFLTEIGLNNVNVEKKERVNTDEVNANNIEIQASVTHWLDSINAGYKVANKLFGLNLRCIIRFDSLQDAKRLNQPGDEGEGGEEDVTS